MASIPPSFHPSVLHLSIRPSIHPSLSLSLSELSDPVEVALGARGEADLVVAGEAVEVAVRAGGVAGAVDARLAELNLGPHRTPPTRLAEV